MTEWIMDYFSTLDVVSVLVIFSVTGVASAVNSVAGGGTILTFPMLNAILPETPSGVALSSNLTKVTDGSVYFDGTGVSREVLHYI